MLTRQWPALCAWGAGLIHLAVVASSSPLWAVLLGAMGALELAWGVYALRSGRMTGPRVVMGAALGAIGVSGIAGLSGSFAGVPLAAATVLLLVIAFAAAAVLRAERRRSPRRSTYEASRQRPGRTLLGLLAGAALVAGLTTPALALTDAGEHAVPHGETSRHGGH
ncbi:hypothetical protein ACPW96_04780 [Micromonospora sp. DT81.3]|uniref:hypothetical protein n=1 Tax=Micromonospora sp. DT81.3 TaxID=3416523 RepID=UPI003CED4D78